MKRSPAYYQNRKRLKELDDNTEYRVNTDIAWEWFHILNEQIFGNLLKPVEKIFISKHKGYGDVYALYYYNHKIRKQPSKISFQKKFKSEKVFVEILAHEMIHHFQYSYDEPVGHGPSFVAWRDNFTLKGLKLYKVR
jgi:SprT-like family